MIGLLTGPEGTPVAVRVFAGNTPDKRTVGEQIRILAESLGVSEVTLVSDQGMLQQTQVNSLNQEGFHYITAITKPQIEDWVRVRNRGATLEVEVDEVALKEVAQLDGCYVIKTDLPEEAATAEMIHARYKDLTEVERAFRTFKHEQLQVQSTFVWTEDSTRGHVFVVMLAYLMERELERPGHHGS